MAQAMPTNGPQKANNGEMEDMQGREGEGGGGFATLVANAYSALSDIEGVLSQAQASPEAVKIAQQLQQGLQALVSALGGQQQGQQQPAGGGTQDAMAGRTGAPMGMQP